MGSPGKGKGEVLSGLLLQQSRDGASASSLRGAIVALRIVQDMGWIPPIVAPIHRRLAKSGGEGGLPIVPFSSRTHGSGKKVVGYTEGAVGGGGGMLALVCLSWFTFFRVGKAASIRAADVRGEKALGFWATKRGIIGRRWRRWSERSGALGVTCGITREGGRGMTRWCLGAHRFLRRLW